VRIGTNYYHVELVHLSETMYGKRKLYSRNSNGYTVRVPADMMFRFKHEPHRHGLDERLG
jgi:hypothetical protein